MSDAGCVGLAGLFRSEEPLKVQLTEAASALRSITSSVDMAIAKMSNRSKELLASAAESYARGEMERARMYANEVALVRNLGQKLSKSRLALEVIEVRIETLMESGNIAAALHPAIEAIRSVKDDIGPVIPQAEEQLSTVGNILGDILASSFHSDIKSLDGVFKTESGEGVLQEVMALVGAQKETSLPAPPSKQPQPSESTEEAGDVSI
ncbi:MAG: hypothetical protein M1357_03095 [Candidatus Marsarchaeota archaeon]|nr:hypothetical protein [Candidatus Marsarchaeota archaeon]